MKIVIGIDGMSCSHCVAGVEKILHAVAGVDSAAVLLNEKQAIVHAATDVVLTDLTQAVEGAGFSIRNVIQAE